MKVGFRCTLGGKLRRKCEGTEGWHLKHHKSPLCCEVGTWAPESERLSTQHWEAPKEGELDA